MLGVINAVVVISGFAVGINWGAEGVAISYAIVTYICFIPFLLFCFNESPLDLGLFLNEIAFPALFSIISGISLYFLREQFVELPPIILCGSGLIAGAIIYLLPWYINKHSKRRFRQILEIGNMLRKKV